MDQNDARNSLNADGIYALGLAAPILAMQWASSDPVASADGFTLTVGAPGWRAPFGGTVQHFTNGCDFVVDDAGLALSGNLTVLSFHPQALLRLERLYASRYGAPAADNSRSLRPVPAHFAIRLSSAPTLGFGEAIAGFQLDAGVASFHDERGLIIDGLAVASAWVDLLTAFPVLIERHVTFSVAGLNTTGAVGHIAGATTTRKIHIVTPNGGPWSAGTGGTSLNIASGASTTAVSTAGPHDFPAGATIAPAASGTMRVGWATNGTLAGASFSVAPLSGGATLKRDFIRICAADLTPCLLGNRTVSNDGLVGGCDVQSAAEPAPLVRDGSPVRLVADGLGALGEINTMLGLLPGSGYQSYLVSTQIEDGMAFPAGTSPASRWPAAPAGGSGAWNPTTVAGIRASSNQVSVRWASSNGNDVVVTIPAGLVPAGAHVRVYPRVFSTAANLWESATLFRGDGGATIAPASGDTVVYLVDPLNLTGQPPGHPPGAHLHFDLHVVPRPPAPTPARERIFGGYDIVIAAATTPVAPPTAATNLLGKVPAAFRGVSSAPIFGTPARSGSAFHFTPPGSNVTQSIIDIVNALAGESGPPRESPRLPTMGRTDTLAAVGIPVTPPPASGDAEVWHGLVMGGPLTHHSYRERYGGGSPGGPAGKEIHTAALAADGQLGYDLALAAARRAESLATRLVDYDGNAWNPLTSAGSSTIAAAVLQTVANLSETAPLALVSDSQLASFPTNWAAVQSWIQSFIPLSLTIANGDRIVQEVRREVYAAKYGRRDYQWAIKRAIAGARDLVYIESPCFSATAHNDSTASATESFDLVDALRSRLTAQKTLRVVIATPKVLNFGKSYASYAKYFYQARADAISSLQSAAPDRVVTFHPIGFPGRPLDIRSTVCAIDDVWCSVGTSAFRRRGFTFDGGCDVTLMDRQLVSGRGKAIAAFRRALMSQYFGVSAPTTDAEHADPNWVRLATPRGAFRAFQDLVADGGRGLVEPLWPGPSDSVVMAQTDSRIADPDGRHVDVLIALLQAFMAAAGDSSA